VVVARVEVACLVAIADEGPTRTEDIARAWKHQPKMTPART
jgi:hypothetical protein